MMHLAHDSLTVVYAMCGLATANSNTRCLMTGSTDLNPHDIVLKSHVSGNSIESSIANLVFDFDNALKFQRIDMLRTKSMSTQNLDIHSAIPGSYTRSAWIGSILSGTGGESAHLFTYDGHGLSDNY
jgi:hypothetical protein